MFSEISDHFSAYQNLAHITIHKGFWWWSSYSFCQNYSCLSIWCAYYGGGPTLYFWQIANPPQRGFWCRQGIIQKYGQHAFHKCLEQSFYKGHRTKPAKKTWSIHSFQIRIIFVTKMTRGAFSQIHRFQIRFSFVTNTTLSFWSKDAVAKRPSLSGLQSTQFTGWSEICN